MSDANYEAAIANSVVALVRYDMGNRAMSDEEAFKAVYRSELYRLLINPATRLCLDSDDELARLYDIELNCGVDALRKELMKRVEAVIG